jgi:hypothetical protein
MTEEELQAAECDQQVEAPMETPIETDAQPAFDNVESVS